MGLINRLTTLAKADAHGVVDALEDRALVLRQHVREAAAELDRKRCRIEGLNAEEKDLLAETARIEEQKQALEEDVTLAMANDKEELARFAIKKLLPLRHATAQIEHRLTALRQERGELEQRLAEQQAEHEQLERRVRGYLAQLKRGSEGAPLFTELVVTDEDVELELLRRRRGDAPQEAEPATAQGGA